MSKVKRVVICGGAYSDNLGDAVIADCLAYGLNQFLPDVEIVKMDIAGRRGYGHVNFRQKKRSQLALTILPSSVGQYLVFFAGSLFFKFRIEPTWQSILKLGDVVVVGGGQLLQDSHLNFPLKLWWLHRNIQRLDGRIAVYSVGVSSKWSRLGRILFAPIFRKPRLLYSSVRDAASKQYLLRHLSSLQSEEIQIDLDPALLTEIVYRKSTNSTEKDFDVGICLMHPQSILLHSYNTLGCTTTSFTEMWDVIIKELASQNIRVALFTNGAREDEEYLHFVTDKYKEAENITILKRAITPTDFVTYIARMESVVAHRLHASIVSYALNIPCLGLTWDTKVEQFYTMCNRKDWLVDACTVSVEELIDKIRRLRNASIDSTTRTKLIQQCSAGIDRLARNLEDTRVDERS